ncbi:MAG: molybdopterin-dependent oxidoreductase, partial [Cellulomonas sp.]|nr:molybdopterin-dependent oxidoreductase [Cellulomonas sp.]
MDDLTQGLGSVLETGTTRRKFLQWSSIAGGSAAALGAAGHYGLLDAQPAAAAQLTATGSGVKTVWSACTVNCGSRCPLNLVVSDGQIVRVDPEPTGDDELGTQQIRACVRGRSIRHRIYNPDRLKYPMRRTGARGDGTFERISWETAFTEIAERLKSVIDQYTNEAVYLNYGTGTLGATVATSWPPASTAVARLMNCVGGYLNHYGDYSAANIEAAYPHHYGTWTPSNSFDDTVNSKLVVLFGNNPAETRMSGGGEVFVSQQAKKVNNTRVIVIDPRYTDTGVTLADEWIPIRPGGDVALVAALAHVMISEGLHDQAFLDRYCVGFDDEHLPAGAPAGSSYKAYVMGDGPDGIAKTPTWAEAITGIPSDTTVRLAREIALAKPVNIMQGWGVQRSANGENAARAIFTLAAMTGCIGIPGGGTGGREGSYSMSAAAFPTLKNPIETAISVYGWTDAITRGTEMTALADGVQGRDKLIAPIKFIWQYAGNALINQHGDTNRTHTILADESLVDTIVVIENQMSVSARYADYLLPDVTTAEQMDLAQQGNAGPLGYLIFADKAIDPLYECKPVYEILTGIAGALGVEQKFSEGKSQEDWVRQIVEATRELTPSVPDFDTLRAQGIYKEKGTATVPLADFRADPAANPLKTPSGKIEIYSAALQKLSDTWELPAGDKITAVAEYFPTWEGIEDALRGTYPLQCIGHHYKARTHSTYGNVDWMKE